MNELRDKLIQLFQKQLKSFNASLAELKNCLTNEPLDLTTVRRLIGATTCYFKEIEDSYSIYQSMSHNLGDIACFQDNVAFLRQKRKQLIELIQQALNNISKDEEVKGCMGEDYNLYNVIKTDYLQQIMECEFR